MWLFHLRYALLATAIALVALWQSHSGDHVRAGADGTITGTVWNDANADGLRDQGEPGLQGWEVWWTSGVDRSARVETSKDGMYELAAVPVEGVHICLSLEEGWVATASSPSPTSDLVYCDDLVGVNVAIAESSTTEVNFGVTQQSAMVSASARCPSWVPLNASFTCSLEVRNRGDLGLENATAYVVKGYCYNPSPCFLGPTSVSPGLRFVSSLPPWTTQDYGLHWDPLLPGVFASGDYATIEVTVVGQQVSHLGEREQFCGQATGHPRFASGLSSAFMITSATVCEQATVRPVGDASRDTDVTSVDAALVLQVSAGLITDPDWRLLGDANSDGAVNALDAALILQYSAGLLSSLPP